MIPEAGRAPEEHIVTALESFGSSGKAGVLAIIRAGDASASKGAAQ